MRRLFPNLLLLAASVLATVATSELASAEYGWDGRRHISYQRRDDLFYNYYEGPQNDGAAAQMYVSPLPVPANVGHTWTTYPGLMPHEFMYRHHRSYYQYNPGAGWTRGKVRYGTAGVWAQYSPIHLSNLLP